MLNIMAKYCAKWRLSLNINKTKAVHFRKRNIRKTKYVYKFKDMIIDSVSENVTVKNWWWQERGNAQC